MEQSVGATVTNQQTLIKPKKPMSSARLFLSVAVMATCAAHAHLVFGQDNVCQILARSLTPDTFIQSSDSEKFTQIQKLVSDRTYDSYGAASSSSFDGTLLSEYVDLFVKTKSDSSSWGEHRRQFLEMSSDTAFSSNAARLRTSTWSVAAMKEVVKCAEKSTGPTAVVEMVSPNRDSFSVLVTNGTQGAAKWAITSFDARPADPALSCENGFQRASVQKPINVINNAVRIVCTKSPNTHFILSVQSTAGPAPHPFTIESVHEEIAQIRAETAAKFQALSERLDKQGIVAAFAASTCPSPWVVYEPAVGRFIRGLDPNGTNDPDGKTRTVGQLQEDTVGPHAHTMGVGALDSTTMVLGVERLANFNPAGAVGGPKKSTDNNAGSETRPKNVALLYCILR